MARQWNPDAISDFTQLPPADYIGAIKEITETATKETGKLMYVATLDVVDGELHGMQQRDNFVIGTDDDPNATDPKTWEASLGAKRLKGLFKKARVPFGKDIDQMCMKAAGHRVGFTIVAKAGVYQGKAVTNHNVSVYREVGGGEAGAEVKTAAIPGGTIAGGLQAQKVPPKKSANITCPTCNESVPKTEFAAHAEQHEEGAE